MNTGPDVWSACQISASATSQSLSKDTEAFRLIYSGLVLIVKQWLSKEKKLLLLHAEPELLKVWEDLVPEHHIYHLVLFKSSDLICNVALSECALGRAAALIKREICSGKNACREEAEETSVLYFSGVWVEESTVIKSWNNRSRSAPGVKNTRRERWNYV